MSSSRSLTQIFKKPLPENPTLIESLSPSYQIRPPMPTVTPAFEFFGELNFFTKKPALSPPMPPSPSPDQSPQFDIAEPDKKKQDNGEDPPIGSIMGVRECTTRNPENSESSQLGTEGLGFESFVDIGDAMKKAIEGCGDTGKGEKGEATGKPQDDKGRKRSKHWRTCSDVRSRCRGGFPPPPISCIGKSGKPWVFLKPYRKDGMLVLKQFRIPKQKYLHATRENGRLRMHFVHPDEEDITVGVHPDEEDITVGGGGDAEEDEDGVHRQEKQEEKDDFEEGVQGNRESEGDDG